MKYLTVFLLMLAGQASAETLGRVTAFLDGAPMGWNLITFELGAEVTSSASFRQTPHKAELILHGYPEARFESRGTLSIEVRFGGVYAEGDQPIGLDILFLPEGLRGPIWTSNDAPEPPRLDIISFDIWGEVGRLEAVVQGQLCLRRYIYSPTDTGHCKSLSAQIATDLAVE